MTVNPTERIFSYAGLSLPDLNRKMSPEEIKAAYSTQYPELATAAINGPEAVGDKLRYEFVRAIGAKG
ncbi:MAG: PRTRC system protein C [Acidobacteria bacterium]|nr:MAG: PRTRC system protein C [Acidobacteriota bacterium]